MATWQELAVPAAAVLGGALLTAVITMLSSARQRQHERRLRLVDEKQHAYLQRSAR